ncbi:hypothetical protein Bca52824_066174 [Brassica carinata]|uniref:Uncharacterized protein n=1 Tax=Brassica carinata TaxID=52824 RepID=A0A8X7UAP4_BRACI|nr:hypothetical protein Bca52824_066174 [Brassica carinata]
MPSWEIVLEELGVSRGGIEANLGRIGASCCFRCVKGLVLVSEVTSPSLSPTFRSFLRSAPEMRTEPGAEEVAIWRKKYELPDDVAIRVPDPEDRVSDFGVDEVVELPWGLEALTHESPDLRAGEYCPSELSVDCLRASYRTWAAWALDVMIVEGLMDPGG